MCLEVLVCKLDSDSQGIGARGLSEETGLVVRAVIKDGRPCLHISGTGACSCDLLAESAAEAAHWRFSDTAAVQLENALRLLAQTAKPFGFVARWLNTEVPYTERQVPLKELLRLVRSHAVQNNVGYRIGHAERGISQFETAYG